MNQEDDIGDRYQELTKYFRNRMTGGARPSRRPAPFKDYPGGKSVALAWGRLPAGSLWQDLENRRSRRTFTAEPISLETLSRLVFAAQGATARAGEYVLRTAPSAGALYPVETYLAANRVMGVDPGVYHYNVVANELEEVKKGNSGQDLAEAALGQDMCARAAVVFCLTAIAGRGQWKYAQRAWRYVYLDAGHIGENVYLAAEDLGLGCCAMGAFYDDEVNAVLGVDGKDETAIYLLAVGPVK